MAQIVTLVLLVKDDKILLAMKKRGFGKGFWNGPGGKIEQGETIEQAMIRECQEEIGVTPTSYEKVALHRFEMEGEDREYYTSIEAHVFLATDWTGEPIETDEMAPKWFKQNEIPYTKMWQDDMVWLPLVLQGKKLETKFVFDQDDQMKKASLTVVDTLS